MDTLFDKAVDVVRQLPEADREEPIDEADRAAVLAAIDQADRGQFASDDHMAGTVKRFGP